MRWLLVAFFVTAATLATHAATVQDDPDAAGKAIVNGVCTTCHAADLITGKSASRTEWKDVVDRMKTYGLSLDDKQTNTLLDYLAKNHGPKQPGGGNAAAGKALLEQSCSGCHDLDLV